MYSTPLITSNISSRMRRIYLYLHIYQTWNAKTQNQTAQVQTISYLLPIIKRRPLSKCRKTAWPLSQTMYNRPGKGKQTVNDSPCSFYPKKDKLRCVCLPYKTISPYDLDNVALIHSDNKILHTDLTQIFYCRNQSPGKYRALFWWNILVY